MKNNDVKYLAITSALLGIMLIAVVFSELRLMRKYEELYEGYMVLRDRLERYEGHPNRSSGYLNMILQKTRSESEPITNQKFLALGPIHSSTTIRERANDLDERSSVCQHRLQWEYGLILSRKK